jgi:HSP20 family protein
MQIDWTPLHNGNGRPARSQSPSTGSQPESTAGPTTPPADVIETKDALVVELELPGHELDDIDVAVAGSHLTVTVERKLQPMPDRTYHRSERPQGVITRSFTLPAIVDNELASATYRHGVLSVLLPKRDELKPRTIPVSIGG